MLKLLYIKLKLRVVGILLLLKYNNFFTIFMFISRTYEGKINNIEINNDTCIRYFFKFIV